MATSKHWLPGAREDVLHMARTWSVVLTSNGTNWNVPVTEKTELDALITKAVELLDKAKSSERTPVITANCKEVFEHLTDKMRFIKDRFFKTPPLQMSDYAALQLKSPDTVPSKRGTPRAQMTAEIGRSGTAMLLLHLKYSEGTEPLADSHTDIEYQVRYGKWNPVNPVLNISAGELNYVPTEPLELPVVFTTKRKRETITFTPSDPGKTAYFAIRISNGNGGEAEGYGPWCPLFSAVIP